MAGELSYHFVRAPSRQVERRRKKNKQKKKETAEEIPPKESGALLYGGRGANQREPMQGESPRARLYSKSELRATSAIATNHL